MVDQRTPIRITQGAPIVNEGYLVEMSDNLAAIELDMKSKNCEVWFTLSPCGICVHETEHSLRLDDEKKGLPTEIYFPDFAGWDVWAFWANRYSIHVCLIKELREDMKTFTVTEDHLKLARCMEVQWQDAGYGAPEIDPRRPYGNSDVQRDIADILGMGEDLTPEQYLLADSLHKDMEIVLEIGLRTGQFKAGVYQWYNEEWKELTPTREFFPSRGEMNPFAEKQKKFNKKIQENKMVFLMYYRDDFGNVLTKTFENCDFHTSTERDNFLRVEDKNGLVFMVPENRVISVERV